MVYTKARLEHALKVFRQSAPNQGRKGLKEHLDRQLRRSTRSSRARVLQSWSFSGAPDGSDEDEYDPAEDRRRMRAPRRRKKQSSDTGDEEKIIKKEKGDELPYQLSNANHLVLKLTTSKSRERLEELSRGRKTRPEYFGRSSGALRRSRSHDDIYGDMDTDEDIEDRDAMMYEAYAPTALRSGRVLNKNVESKSNDNNTIQSNRPTSSSDAKGRDGSTLR